MKAIALFLALTVSAAADNWSQFRGPTGLGYSAERDLPLSWDVRSGENIAWRAPLPKSDNPYSSPIVWNDRVFVTCVTNEPLSHRVLCFATTDGALLWDVPVEPGPLLLRDFRGGYGAATPCTDGEHVYAMFGSGVIAALDFAGKQVWRKTLANVAFDVAQGSSPMFPGYSMIVP